MTFHENHSARNRDFDQTFEEDGAVIETAGLDGRLDERGFEDDERLAIGEQVGISYQPPTSPKVVKMGVLKFVGAFLHENEDGEEYATHVVQVEPYDENDDLSGMLLTLDTDTDAGGELVRAPVFTSEFVEDWPHTVFGRRGKVMVKSSAVDYSMHLSESRKMENIDKQAEGAAERDLSEPHW